MTGLDNYGNRAMTVHEASLWRLRLEHNADVSHEVGGATWYCSCGRHGDKGGSYPTEAQANARRDRHLRGARARIQREIETAIDLGGCGTPWADPAGDVHTCNEHRPDLLFIHADDTSLWDGGNRYEPR